MDKYEEDRDSTGLIVLLMVTLLAAVCIAIGGAIGYGWAEIGSAQARPGCIESKSELALNTIKPTTEKPTKRGPTK